MNPTFKTIFGAVFLAIIAAALVLGAVVWITGAMHERNETDRAVDRYLERR